MLDPGNLEFVCFRFVRPLLLSCPRLVRFRNQGTVGNPRLRTTCFLSPHSSLVAPPERLSPVRPVSNWTPRKGLSATTGSYNTRPRAPGNPPFTFFPVARNTAGPLLLRDPGACCTHTPYYTPHDLCSTPPPLSRYVFTEYSYIRAIMHSPLVLPNPPMHSTFRFFAPLPRTLTPA